MMRLIRGETVRLFATRLPFWSAMLAVLAGGGVTGLLAIVGPADPTTPIAGLDSPDGVGIVVGINGLLLFVPALIGTIAVTGEYRHRTIGGTFLAAPRRGAVLASKLLVYGALGSAYGLLTAMAAGLAVVGAASAQGLALGVSLGELALLLVRLAAAAAVYTVIGVAIGALARHQLLAVGVVLGYFYFLEHLLMIIPGVNTIYPYLPGGATSALLDFTFLGDAIGSETSLLVPATISVLAGAGVLLVYAAAASLAAIAVPLRRDLG